MARVADTLRTSGDKVYAYGNDIADLASRGLPLDLNGKKYTTKQDYISQQIIKLKIKAEEARQSEEQFYTDMNLNLGSYSKNLKELQDRITRIRSSGLENLTDHSGVIIKEALGIQSYISSSQFLDPITKLINDRAEYIVQQNPQIGEATVQLTAGMVLDVLSKGINKGDFKTDASIKGFSSRPNTRFNTTLIIERDQNNPGKFIVREADSNNFHIPSDDKKAIRKMLEALNIETPQAKENFYEGLEKIISTYVHGEQARKAIQFQFRKNIDKYDVVKKPENIAGFLGEIEFNAIMAILCGNPYMANPTGNLRRTGQYFKGAEVSVDAVVKACGFQIKNFSLKGEQITFEAEDKRAGDLFGQRMELTEMVDLISAYQYNRPIEGAQNGYSSLYKKVSNFVKGDIQSVFRANADKLIGLSNENYNEFTDDPFESIGGVRGGKNTFFYVKGKLVPASGIYQGLIKSLQGKRNSLKTISSAMTSISSPTDTYKYENMEQALNDNTSRKAAANEIRVSWEVMMDLGKVVNEALNYIYG